jgi:hypothetical protein
VAGSTTNRNSARRRCIERVNDDLQEKVDQFEEREDALRERFQDAMR